MDENEKQSNNKDLKVLRTYTSDMAEAIRNNEMSVIKIALAEKEKREQEGIYQKAEGTNITKILFIVGGIIFIAAAIVGSYFLIQDKKETPLITKINPETFISYNSKSYIDVTNTTDILELSKTIKQQRQANFGLIEALFLTKKINEIPEILTSKDFFSLIKTTAPEILIRSLSDRYLFGKYSNPSATNEQDKSATFLILETTDYSRAYVSMLDWEKTMLKDLFILFEINTSKLNKEIFEKPWSDIIVNNKDARVLYGEYGEGILYYVFVNKNSFVIANNAEALKEVITRLITKNIKPL